MPLLDKLRKLYGVGPVCSELHIAPSTYYHCQQQRHHPDKRSARAQRDDWLKKEILRVYDGNHQVYVCVKSGVSCYGKVSEWPDALWHVSCRLWDLPVFSGVKGPYDHQPESRCRRRPRKPSVRGRTT
ncbi:Transposase [Shigella flexneri CDC 796-83]|uniref:Transposase n=1 Tax=Shigella flexneri CDC 796-83 TaxID=945360 RepID=A0A6N3QDX7_SHIFL|nr:Transposase [Shigella flexneri CDC 796-83]